MGILRKLRGSVRLDTAREHVTRFATRAAQSVKPGQRVLDAGAGNGMYRSLFNHAQYESADFCQVNKEYAQITHVCDLAQIPVEDQRFDAILFTQVLEHLREPADVLIELRRVLKPGGRIWLSAPLYYAEHEVPYDFFRYTQFGLRHLLEKTGFRIISLEWTEGYFGTLAYQVNFARYHLPWRPRDFGGGVLGFVAAALVFASRPFLLVLALLFAAVDLRHKYTSRGHCLDYSVLAERPLAS